MGQPIDSPSTLDWGRTRHAEATARQIALVAQRLAGEIGDTLVFTEHDPVFTLGLRKDAPSHLVWNESQLAHAGIEVAQTNRGGDITYHGPGQDDVDGGDDLGAGGEVWWRGESLRPD